MVIQQSSGRPRKRFGQHFLTDQGVLQQMVNALGLMSEHNVFEIGPGQGALTDQLYPLISATEGQYTAVEIDRDLVPWLKARFSKMHLVNDDVLKVDLRTFLATGANWRVVGNLPYNISSPILVKLIELVRRAPALVCDMHFMLQKEMADRLAAQPGSKAWGRLSVLTQLTFTADVLFDVSPEAFSPPPRVWSSVIRLVPNRTELDPGVYDAMQKILRLAFSGRRKRLSNSLKSLNLDWHDLATVEASLRPDDVTTSQFLEIAKLHVQNVTHSQRAHDAPINR